MKENKRTPARGSPSEGASSFGETNTDETLRSERIQIERKMFVFTLKENPRGRFLRITEDVGGRRDTIIIPATGLNDFARVIEEMTKGSHSQAEADESDVRQP